MTTTAETSEPLARAEKAAAIAGVGIVAMLVGESAHVAPLMLVGGVATAIGAAMAMSAGWFVGLTPQGSAPAAPSAGLVGSRIRFGGSVFTVLDDATPSAAAALRGGGRCSVMAVDGGGRTGVLFLELDPHGAVVAAATAELDWAAAGAVSESNSTHF